MLQQFKDYIDQQHLFSSGEEVLLAVSGGRDSVCLAHLMHEAGYRFAIGHCNFHLRPGDCDRDQDFVRQLASRLAVPFHTVDFDTRNYAAAQGQSLEESARTLRYGWFADLCHQQGYPCVVTAHHADDAIETFFLNLFRGTGIAGLHGIRPLQRLSFNSLPVTVVRPMLAFPRAAIDAYVDEHALPFVEDSTNALLEARRNRIRHRLMPLLRELYPGVDATMQGNMQRLADTEVIFSAAVDQLRQRLVVPFVSRVPTVRFPVERILVSAIPEPRRTLLYEFLRPYGFNVTVVDDILRNPTAVGSRFRTHTHQAVIGRHGLYVAARVEPVAPTLVEEEEARFAPGTASVLVDADSLQRPLSLRLWQPGDRYYPLGMTHRRLVSDAMKDRGLNRIEREHVFVVVDAADRIVWVVGVGIDNRFRLENTTQHVARLSVKA